MNEWPRSAHSTEPPAPRKHSMTGGRWIRRFAAVKCRGRGGPWPIFIPPSGCVHSTTTIATAVAGNVYDSIWVWQTLVRSEWIRPDETTMRVRGWRYLPWSGFVACQPGGSATVTSPVPTRGDAATTSATSTMASFAYNSGIAAEHLARMIVEAQPCVVLTGAGVSTESGIPDFRSATGIWARYDPMEYATIEAFGRDPAKVWDFYAKRLGVLAEARPNAAHAALAELGRRGLVEAVITQNVDGLHQAAGSRRVIEVHGSIRTAGCLSCGHREEYERVAELGPVPACADCGAVLKPDVVMFGEPLPAGAMEAASELVRRAGLLLVVGSSLEVYPVAGLPEDALQAGARLAIVNRGPTPYDRRADLKIDASAGETLAAALEALQASSPAEL